MLILKQQFGRLGVATLCMMAGASHAGLVVYEGFDYAVGVQNGLNGGTGFAGAWEDMTAGSNAGEGYVYSSSGNTEGTNGNKPDWDGAVDNLPQTGGYIGLSPFVNDSTQDRNNARRALAQSAGAMAGADRILWMSMAVHFEDNRFNFSPGLMLTDGGGFSERVRDITDGSTGIGIGHGSAWGIDLNAITYNAGAFDTRTNISNISTTLDNVIVLKYEFGDTTDKVSAWFFTEDQALSEAVFDANALSTTSTFNIDEFTLDTLAVGITRAGNAYDEIRIGDSFTDVVTPEPTSLALLGLGGMLVARRRRV